LSGADSPPRHQVVRKKKNPCSYGQKVMAPSGGQRGGEKKNGTEKGKLRNTQRTRGKERPPKKINSKKKKARC